MNNKYFYSKIIEKLDRKKAKLEEMYKKYEALMSLSDEELAIRNANERVLKNLAYNSPLADEKLKRCIENRSLENLTIEEFEFLYKQALYGIEGKDYGEDKSEKDQVAIIKDLDQVPQPNDLDLIKLKIGKIFIKKCQELEITKKDILEWMYPLTQKYETDIYTVLRVIVKCIKRGISIDEIKRGEFDFEGLLEAYHSLNFGEGRFHSIDIKYFIPYDLLIEIHNKFDVPFEELANYLHNIEVRVLKKALKLKKEIPFIGLEDAIETILEAKEEKKDWISVIRREFTDEEFEEL